MKISQNSDIIRKFDSSLYGSKNLKESLGLLFNENTKFDKFSIQRQFMDIQNFSNEYIYERSSQPYKLYPTKTEYDLTIYLNSIQPPKINYIDLLCQRSSVRNYTSYSISLNELALLCHYSYGILRRENKLGLRSVPSAGALYPLELYIYINTSILPQGIYHYSPKNSTLELIQNINCLEKLSKILVAEPYVNLENCSCIFFITSFFERLLIKYGDRGYKFLLQEVGAVSQNLSLLLESIDLGSCILGSFIDDDVNDLLEADGVFESIQSVIVVGKPNK